MKAPNKIYLQVCGECPEQDCKNCKFEDLENNVTWCKDRIYKKDEEYICKDAILEWVKERGKHYRNRQAEIIDLSGLDDIFFFGKEDAFKEIITKIESL